MESLLPFLAVYQLFAITFVIIYSVVSGNDYRNPIVWLLGSTGALTYVIIPKAHRVFDMDILSGSFSALLISPIGVSVVVGALAALGFHLYQEKYGPWPWR